MAAAFVRLPLPAAFVAAGFAVVPPGALGVAGFRLVDLLDWDLDAVLVLLVSMEPDMRIARQGATLWRGDRARRRNDTGCELASSGSELRCPVKTPGYI